MNTISKNDIILTGIPRSGTTLACAMIFNLSNAVCLSEPEIINQFIAKAGSIDEYTAMIEKEFTLIRNHIWKNKKIENKKGLNGELLTNYYSRNSDGEAKVNFKLEAERVEILNKKFVLGIKHNAHFMSVLTELARNQGFSIYVVIRDPINTVLSWRSLSLPISEGRLPAAEKFWPEIRHISNSNESLLVRQVMILEQFFQKIYENKDSIHIIIYEELVKDPHYFEKIFHQESLRYPEFKPKSINLYKNENEAQSIFEHMERFAPSAFLFYPNLKRSLNTSRRVSEQ